MVHYIQIPYSSLLHPHGNLPQQPALPQYDCLGIFHQILVVCLRHLPNQFSPVSLRLALPVYLPAEPHTGTIVRHLPLQIIRGRCIFLTAQQRKHHIRVPLIIRVSAGITVPIVQHHPYRKIVPVIPFSAVSLLHPYIFRSVCPALGILHASLQKVVNLGRIRKFHPIQHLFQAVIAIRSAGNGSRHNLFLIRQITVISHPVFLESNTNHQCGPHSHAHAPFMPKKCLEVHRKHHIRNTIAQYAPQQGSKKTPDRASVAVSHQVIHKNPAAHTAQNTDKKAKRPCHPP